MSTQPAWLPTASADNVCRCQNCGSQHTPQFGRVFGDNSDTAHHCRHCVPYRDLKRGAGSDPDYTRGDR